MREERQTGRTTEQMLAAEQDSFYLCSEVELNYAMNLANDIGRKDLRVVSPSWLERNAWRGRILTGFTVDHDTQLTAMQTIELERCIAYQLAKGVPVNKGGMETDRKLFPIFSMGKNSKY